MSFEVENIDLVLRKLKQLDPDNWKKDVLKEMRGDHKAVRSAMRSNAPVEEGKLKRSIRTNSWAKRRRDGEMALFVRTGPRYRNPGRVWYAHFVELGTPNQPAAHFIKDTFGQFKDSLEAGIRQAIINAVNKRF